MLIENLSTAVGVDVVQFFFIKENIFSSSYFGFSSVKTLNANFPTYFNVGVEEKLRYLLLYSMYWMKK